MGVGFQNGNHLIVEDSIRDFFESGKWVQWGEVGWGEVEWGGLGWNRVGCNWNI